MLSDCSNAHILEIAERVIEDIGGLLIKNKDILLSFLAEKQIDGAMLSEYEKRVFCKEVIAFADGNKKVNGPSGKLLKAMQSFDLSKLAVDKGPMPTVQCSFIFPLCVLCEIKLWRHDHLFLVRIWLSGFVYRFRVDVYFKMLVMP